jgi:glycosyltransferase involved in cell wall biosynthesis
MNQLNEIPVSIGIPTYNRAAGFFRQALESALAKSYEPLEIIVCDNCSTDDTTSLVLSYNDPRIRYFRHEKNIDANDNFNFCLQKATGAYFLLLHDDDLIDPTFVRECMTAAEGKTDIGIIRTGTRLIDGKGNVAAENLNSVAGLSLKDFFKAWLTGKTALYFCSTMFNTEGLKAIGGFKTPSNLFQDVVAEFCLTAAWGHADVRAALASYRRHDANRGDAVKVMAWCDDCLYLLQLMQALVPEGEKEIGDLGRIFFSRKCYRKAVNIPGLTERWTAYWRVYRCFNYAVKPSWTIKKDEFARFKSKIKEALGR